jgi:hypothetical protein
VFAKPSADCASDTVLIYKKPVIYLVTNINLFVLFLQLFVLVFRFTCVSFALSHHIHLLALLVRRVSANTTAVIRCITAIVRELIHC